MKNLAKIFKNKLSILIKTTKIIPVSRCIHYCGFQYGNNIYNPYETYIKRIHNMKDNIEARKEFIDFIRFYRPEDFAEALGISLSKNHDLWQFPWKKYKRKHAWVSNPETVPDILTHFSKAGILYYRITEEFYWLERAYYNIKKHGYMPRLHNSFISVAHLHSDNEEDAYIVLDGNHRVSAISTIEGENTSIECRILYSIAENDVANWPQVKSGIYSKDDAIAIFHAYLRNNDKYHVSNYPSPLIY